MERLNDELLNKYIDGELSRNEVDEINRLIENDPSALKRLQGLKAADQIYNKMVFDAAPDSISASVMKKIYLRNSHESADRKFFGFIISSIAAIAIGLIGWGTTQETGDDKTIQTFADKTYEAILPVLNSFTEILSSRTFLLFALFLTIIFVTTAYFILDSHKAFKDKLNSIGN